MSSQSSSIFSFDFLVEVAKSTIIAGASTVAVGLALSWALKSESCCDSENIKKEKKTSSNIDHIIGEKPDELKLVIDMIDHKTSYEQIKSSFPKALLFVGPPGTGKTEMARALANKMNAKFFEICGSEIESKWVGESSQNIQTMFKNARSVAASFSLPTSPSSSSSPSPSPSSSSSSMSFLPKCVVFIDEIETIAPCRESGITSHHNHQVLGTLLTEMTKSQSNSEILIIGATNHLHMLDKAILRPGRFDNIIDFKLPNSEDRKKILKHYAYQYKLQNKMEIKEGKIKMNCEIDFDSISNQLDGLSGAHIKELCLKASRFAAFDKQDFIRYSDFIKAINVFQKRNLSEKYEHMYL